MGKIRWKTIQKNSESLSDDPISHMAPVQSRAPHMYRAEAQDTNDGPFDVGNKPLKLLINSMIP